MKNENHSLYTYRLYMTKHSFLAEVTFKCTLYTRNDHLDYKREQEIITDRKPFFFIAHVHSAVQVLP